MTMKTTFAAVMVASFAFGASAASAALIDLGFSLDESTSVGKTNFKTARDALADALGSIPTSGPNQYRLAITTYSYDVRTVIKPTIVTAGNIATLQATLKSIGYRRGGTSTDKAITKTFDLFKYSAMGLGDTSLINITTDGIPRSQKKAEAAALTAYYFGLDGLSFEAVGKGISSKGLQSKMARIAGLGTAGDASNGVVLTGVNSIPNATTTGFVLPVATFSDYQAAIKAKVGKVVVDTGGGTNPSPVPLPAGLPLLLVGMGALGVVRSRRKAA